MKRIVGFCGGMLSLIMLMSCGGEKNPDAIMGDVLLEMREDDRNYKVGDSLRYSGPVTYYDRAGTIRLKTMMENGLPIRTESFTIDGTSKGWSEYDYDDSGKVIYESTYDKNRTKREERTALYIREWFANGMQKSEANFDENQLPHGVVMLWDSTGAVVDSAFFVKGVQQ